MSKFLIIDQIDRNGGNNKAIKMNRLIKFGGLKDELYFGERNGSDRAGIGIQLFISYSVYFGQWEKNKANGIGKLIFTDGTNCVGLFKNNLFIEGTVYYSTGAIFSGKFDGSADEYFLAGKFIFANKMILEGKWDKNGFLCGKLKNTKRRSEEIIDISFEDQLEYTNSKRFRMKDFVFTYNSSEGICIDNNKRTLLEGNITNFEFQGVFSLYNYARKICLLNFEKNCQKGLSNEVNIERGFVKNYELKIGSTHFIYDMFLLNGLFIKFNEDRTFSEVLIPALGDDRFVKNGQSMTLNFKSWDTRFNMNSGKYTFSEGSSTKSFKIDNMRNPVECVELIGKRINFESLMERYINVADNMFIEKEANTGKNHEQVYSFLSKWISEIVNNIKQKNILKEYSKNDEILNFYKESSKLKNKESQCEKMEIEKDDPFESQISPIRKKDNLEMNKIGHQEENIEHDFNMSQNQIKFRDESFHEDGINNEKRDFQIEKRKSNRIQERKNMGSSSLAENKLEIKPVIDDIGRSKSRNDRRKMKNIEEKTNVDEKDRSIEKNKSQSPVKIKSKSIKTGGPNLRTRDKIKLCNQVIKNIINERINYVECENNILLKKYLKGSCLQNYRENPQVLKEFCLKIEREVEKPKTKNPMSSAGKIFLENDSQKVFEVVSSMKETLKKSSSKSKSKLYKQNSNFITNQEEKQDFVEKSSEMMLFITKNKNKNLSGFCTTVFLDGTMFKGFFKNGEKDGKGVFFGKDRCVYLGMYNNDRPIDVFQKISEDGSKKDGFYKNGRFCEKSSEKFKDFRFSKIDEPNSDYSEIGTLSLSDYQLSIPFLNNVPNTQLECQLLKKKENLLHRGRLFMDDNFNVGTFKDSKNEVFITNLKRKKVCKILI